MAENKDLFRSLADGTRKLAGTVTETLSEGGVVRTVYENGLNRARRFAQLTKMTADLSREKEELQRVFLEIGQLFYEQAKDAPEGFFVPLFEQVQEIGETLAKKEAEIEALREEFEGTGQRPGPDKTRTESDPE